MDNKASLVRDIPVGMCRFLLVENKYILEIQCRDCSKYPLNYIYAGRCGCGDNMEAAYRDAWKRAGDEFRKSVTDRVANYIGKDVDESCDQFCGSDGCFSPKELFNFCREHNIKLDDILLVQPYSCSRGAAVMFITNDEFGMFSGKDLLNASEELKNFVLDKSMEFLETYNKGYAYFLFLNDKDGECVDSIKDCYGNVFLESSTLEIIDEYSDTEPKDLGIYECIEDCLEEKVEEINIKN